MRIYSAAERALYGAAEGVNDEYMRNFDIVGFGNTRFSRFAMNAFVDDEANTDKKVLITSDATETYLKGLYTRKGLDHDNIYRVDTTKDIRYMLASRDDFIRKFDMDPETLKKISERMNARANDIRKMKRHLNHVKYVTQLSETSDLDPGKLIFMSNLMDGILDIDFENMNFNSLDEKRQYIMNEIEKTREGLKDVKVFAENLGLSLGNMKKIYRITSGYGTDYLYVSGADQIDPVERHMIKGGIKNTNTPGFGGSIQRDKDIANHSREFIVLADEHRVVDHLGYKGYPLPVEFKPGNDALVKDYIEHVLEQIGLAKKLRKRKGNVGSFITENGMNVFDVPFDGRKYKGSLPMIEHDLELQDEITSSGLFSLKKPSKVFSTRKDSKSNKYRTVYPITEADTQK